jgi:transposase
MSYSALKKSLDDFHMMKINSYHSSILGHKSCDQNILIGYHIDLFFCEVHSISSLFFFVKKYPKMSTQHDVHAKTVQQLWNRGIRNAAEIQKRTGVPRSTVYYNISKLKKTGSVMHLKRSGRPRKISSQTSKFLVRKIKKNPSVSTKALSANLLKKEVQVSHVTVWNHLTELGYKKNRAEVTPMLTKEQIQKRVAWAKKYRNFKWERTVFSDETSFQLFRNTIKYWYKGDRPVRRIPKEKKKIFAWGGFWARGKTSLFCFQQIMNGAFYVEILEKHFLRLEGGLGVVGSSNMITIPSTPAALLKRF